MSVQRQHMHLLGGDCDCYYVDHEDQEPVETCRLCAHVIGDECGAGERDYFETGDVVCECCIQAEDDPEGLEAP